MSEELNTGVLGKIDKALATVAALCQGEIRWTMSVPAVPDRDPDLVIADALQSARAALAVAPSVPKGWALVPIEPTEKMLDVLHENIRIECIPERHEANIKNDQQVWKDVVDAAPIAPSSPV